MNGEKQHNRAGWVWAAFLLGAIALGVVFSLPAAPAAASPLPQATGYPYPYPYPDDATPTFTSTVGTSPTVTATRQGTLPAPRPSGTPTQLVPVTGADLNGESGASSAGMWIALWLVGLLLIGFGARARLRQH